MTNKERMQAGKCYLPFDQVLAEERLEARRMLRRYNSAEPEAFEARMQLLRELLGTCGNDVYIEPPFRCDYGYNIHAGDDFYANFGCVILDCGPVNIGSGVMFGPYVQVYPVSHPLDAAQRSQGHEYAAAITIEDHVWVGGGSILLPGITIGQGTVIGAGSVVTKDIPPCVLAAGNPCKVIRDITDEDREAFQRDYLDA